MKSDNVLKLTLTDEEYAWVKKQPKGYVRDLVRDAMGLNEVYYEPEVATTVDELKDKLETGVGVVYKPIVEKRESPQNDRLATFRCKECDHVKSAGRCINSNCKLKGKLQ